MDRCLLDTSAVSDVIQSAKNRSQNVANHLASYLRAHGHVTFSEISCYEVLRGLRMKSASAQLRKFAEFCQRSELLPVNYAILDRAASLWAEGRQTGFTVDDGDLIIAATALEHRIRLITSNTKHFAWIAGLTLANWREP